MPKLTETTNDKNKGRRHSGNGGKLHIVEAHEPLSNGECPEIPLAIPSLAQFQIPPQLVPLPPPTPTTQVDNAPIKIALIGTAPSSRMLAPFTDPTWKIWACSPGNQNVLPRIDGWFEIHSNLLWPEHKHYGEPYIKWLKEQKFPVYMQDQSLVPNAISFPKDELVKMFGRAFFTSSFAWMMAYAIYVQSADKPQRDPNLPPHEIALYGIDMASRDEYILQRPGFYFFQHMAEIRGIRVSAPHESDIMMPPGLYGYSERMPFARKLHARRKEIKERIASMEQQRQQMHDNLTYLKGADEDIDYILSIWSGVQDHPPE